MKDGVRNQTNFAIVPEWVLFSDLSSNAIRLYAALYRHADKRGHGYPSQKRLAEECHVGLSTVKRALRELQKFGAVTVTPRHDEAGDLTSSDYLVRQVPEEGQATDEPTSGQERSDGRVTDGPTVGSPVGEGTKATEREPLEREKNLAAAPRPHRRDLIWEALCEVEGVDWRHLNSGEAGKIKRARKLAAESGATAAQIVLAARAWPAVMGDATMGANGVMHNFQKLLNGRPRGPGRLSAVEKAMMAARAMGEGMNGDEPEASDGAGGVARLELPGP